MKPREISPQERDIFTTGILEAFLMYFLEFFWVLVCILKKQLRSFMKLKIIILMVMANALCACSSLGKSVMLGASLGGVSGALMGEGVSSNQSSGRATGALVGAAVGGIIGYFAHKEKSDVKTTQKATEDDVPLLTRPKVRRVWVKDEIKGHRFVKGHWEYVLEENSVWSK